MVIVSVDVVDSCCSLVVRLPVYLDNEVISLIPVIDPVSTGRRDLALWRGKPMCFFDSTPVEALQDGCCTLPNLANELFHEITLVVEGPGVEFLQEI
jgi:hypothetical protein